MNATQHECTPAFATGLMLDELWCRCLQVLSGFLDKMVTDPKRYDQWSHRKENAHLGLDPETPWENSRESYASFVRHLSAAGLEKGVRAPCSHVVILPY